MYMRRRIAAATFLVGVFTSTAAHELVATDMLRANYIGQNPVQAFVDPSTKEVRGPSAEITRELATRLQLPYVIKGAQGPAGVIDSVRKGEADIGFVAYDPARAVEVDFSQTYSLVQNTYLVLEDSPLKSVEDMDRPGLRLGVAERDAGDYFLTRTLKNASLERNPGGNIEVAVRLLRAGVIHAYAANRQRLTEFMSKTPGVRVVNGNFYGVEQAVIVQKGNKALLEAVNAFLDEARSSGLIAGSIARAGLSGVDVAPPREMQQR